MTTVVHIYSCPESERYALVRGPLGRWFREQRIPAMKVAMHGGYFLRSERVSDVMSRLDWSGYLVRYVEGSAPPYVPPTVLADDLAS